MRAHWSAIRWFDRDRDIEKSAQIVGGVVEVCRLSVTVLIEPSEYMKRELCCA